MTGLYNRDEFIRKIKSQINKVNNAYVLFINVDNYSNFTDIFGIKEGNNLPDLLLVDGGKGQLSIATEVLNKLNLSFPYAGLVKNDKHQTRGLIFKDEEITLKRELLTLLASMQEEVHRFAITSHRHKRTKATYVSVLDNIKGLGKKRQALLLKTYLSLDTLKVVSLEELSQLIPKDVALRVIERLSEL